MSAPPSSEHGLALVSLSSSEKFDASLLEACCADADCGLLVEVDWDDGFWFDWLEVDWPDEVPAEKN